MYKVKKGRVKTTSANAVLPATDPHSKHNGRSGHLTFRVGDVHLPWEGVSDGRAVIFEGQATLSMDLPLCCVLTNLLDVAALNKSNTFTPCLHLCHLSICSLLPSAVLSSSPHHLLFILPCQDALPQVPC